MSEEMKTAIEARMLGIALDEAKAEIERLRSDARILLADFDMICEATGESLDPDDMRLVDEIRAALAAPETVPAIPPVSGMDERTKIERVAKALHDHEGEDWTWPEDETDDGYRGDRSYVRITPKHIQMRYRDTAKAALAAAD